LRPWRGLPRGSEGLWELGAEVISIGVEPNGVNITAIAARRARGTVPESAGNAADIGIALDGDADRVIIVDERGHLVAATSSWR